MRVMSKTQKCIIERHCLSIPSINSIVSSVIIKCTKLLLKFLADARVLSNVSRIYTSDIFGLIKVSTYKYCVYPDSSPMLI